MNESAERQLRRGLRILVADPVPAPPAAAAVRAGRALRRRRRIAVTLAGLAAAAVVAVAVAPLPHRPARPVTVGAPGTPSTAASSPAPSRLPLVNEHGGDIVYSGPGHPAIGTPYPFDLHIHCGIRYANFGGAWWQAEHMQPNYRPSKQDSRSMTYLLGTMTLVGPDELRFDAQDEPLHLTFRPLTGKLEGCD